MYTQSQYELLLYHNIGNNSFLPWHKARGANQPVYTLAATDIVINNVSSSEGQRNYHDRSTPPALVPQGLVYSGVPANIYTDIGII